jgi:hypothetical protein
MANNIIVKDSASVVQTVKTTDTAGVHTPHHIVDSMPAVTGTVAVSNLPATQPISATSLPLPTGAATESTLAARLAEATFTARIGEVQASPTVNTVLDRLKTIAGNFATLASDAVLQAVRDRLPSALVGGRLDVNVGAALPVGTNNIGNVGIATMPAVALDSGTLAALETIQVGSLPSLPAGENHVGRVTLFDDVLEITLSLDTVAYAAGDVLADTQEITGAFRVAGGALEINSIIANDKDDQGQPFDIFFLRSNVSLGAENAAPSITDANADEILAIFSTGAWIDLGGCRVSQAFVNPSTLKAAGGSTSLWIAAITRGTPTHTASGITLKIGVRKS